MTKHWHGIRLVRDKAARRARFPKFASPNSLPVGTAQGVPAPASWGLGQGSPSGSLPHSWSSVCSPCTNLCETKEFPQNKTPAVCSPLISLAETTAGCSSCPSLPCPLLCHSLTFPSCSPSTSHFCYLRLKLSETAEKAPASPFQLITGTSLSPRWFNRLPPNAKCVFPS